MCGSNVGTQYNLTAPNPKTCFLVRRHTSRIHHSKKNCSFFLAFPVNGEIVDRRHLHQPSRFRAVKVHSAERHTASVLPVASLSLPSLLSASLQVCGSILSQR